MKIYGFIHLLMINHWVDIIKEQLAKIKSSGLYEACEEIQIGCLGDYAYRDILEQIIKDYYKVKILYHSSNVNEFEFPTLRLLKQKCEESGELFYAFYIHSKGVSYGKKRLSAMIGGIHWRHYMEFYILTRWKDCVKKLDEGYDTCGVKLLGVNESPAKQLHYSGNFFFIRSDYAKRLCPIESLNHTDRFQAEFWQCSANPNAATLCQDFIDYRAKGKFKPPLK